MILIVLTILGEAYKARSSSLCSFIQSFVTSSLLGPSAVLYNVFPNTLNLCSPHRITDQVSHPYKTAGGTVYSLSELKIEFHDTVFLKQLIHIHLFKKFLAVEHMLYNLCSDKCHYTPRNKQKISGSFLMS
jgi:hypothetical protein